MGCPIDVVGLGLGFVPSHIAHSLDCYAIRYVTLRFSRVTTFPPAFTVCFIVAYVLKSTRSSMKFSLVQSLSHEFHNQPPPPNNTVTENQPSQKKIRPLFHTSDHPTLYLKDPHDAPSPLHTHVLLNQSITSLATITKLAHPGPMYLDGSRFIPCLAATVSPSLALCSRPPARRHGEVFVNWLKLYLNGTKFSFPFFFSSFRGRRPDTWGLCLPCFEKTLLVVVKDGSSSAICPLCSLSCLFMTNVLMLM